MSDTKISEAAIEASAEVLHCVESASSMDQARDLATLVIQAALPHLQGKAVPVAWVLVDDCSHDEAGDWDVEFNGTTLDAIAASNPGGRIPLYLHPQPAELAEQQGVDFDVDDARELFEEWAKGRDLTPDTWGTSSYMSPHVDNDWDVWFAAWKALAATGKQQVGEDSPARRSDRIFNEMRKESAQQVGEVQGDEFSDLLDELRDVEDYFKDVDPNPIHLATVQSAIEFTIARQPGAQEHLREAIATVCEGWTLPADARKILEKAMWEYAPPAQGIDLGQLQDAARWRWVCKHRGVMLLTCFFGNGCVNRTIEEVEALIDQRDAAPGVGNG